MTRLDPLNAERIKGIKGIMPVFEKLYDIHSWRGAKKFILREKLPLRYTQAGQPFFFKEELAQAEIKYQNLLMSE